MSRNIVERNGTFDFSKTINQKHLILLGINLEGASRAQEPSLSNCLVFDVLLTRFQLLVPRARAACTQCTAPAGLRARLTRGSPALLVMADLTPPQHQHQNQQPTSGDDKQQTKQPTPYAGLQREPKSGDDHLQPSIHARRRSCLSCSSSNHEFCSDFFALIL